MSKLLKLAGALLALTIGSLPALAGSLGVGREATTAEIAAWNISIRPDGQGLPKGKGTVKQGEEIFQERCAACHGEFGEGKDRWPVLAGGQGTLTADRPEKTVGSYWPYASTIMDYVRRAMPFGNAQSLTPDELYAITAYILQMNDIVKDPAFELSDRNFSTIKMPNEKGFFLDDREISEKHFWTKTPCMKDCKKSTEIIGRAMAVDVTPDGKSGPKVD